jgi:predicted CopG family antitoxin
MGCERIMKQEKQYKTVTISKELWDTLIKRKYEKGFSSIGELITDLLKKR